MLPCQEDITTQVNLSTVENIDSSLVKLYIRHVYVENLKICSDGTGFKATNKKPRLLASDPHLFRASMRDGVHPNSQTFMG
jgi:hypothetical protein